MGWNSLLGLPVCSNWAFGLSKGVIASLEDPSGLGWRLVIAKAEASLSEIVGDSIDTHLTGFFE